jgi:hypothetical protein
MASAFKISDTDKLPLDRAQTKREQLERELKKCPDFQLYLITEAHNDRVRMERVLMKNPAFRLWRLLTDSIAIANASCSSPSIGIRGADDVVAVSRQALDALKLPGNHPAQ